MRVRQFATVGVAEQLDDPSTDTMGLVLDGHRCTCESVGQKFILTHHVVILNLDDWTRTLPGITLSPAPPPWGPDAPLHVPAAVADSRVAAMVWEWWLAHLNLAAYGDLPMPPRGAPFSVQLGDHSGRPP
jgi:hypothetical protein